MRPPSKIREIRLTEPETDTLEGSVRNWRRLLRCRCHREKAGPVAKLNDLRSSTRPMVWINEIPWHEMNVDDELTLRLNDPWARELETRLRRTLYQWRHMPGDMVVSDFIECPLAIHSTDFGILEDVDVATDRRGQRNRLAALSTCRSGTEGHREDPHAGSHARRADDGGGLYQPCEGCSATSCR